MYKGLIYDKKAWNGKGEHLHERKSRHGASITRVSRRWNRHPTILGAGATLQLEPLCLHEEVRAVHKNVPCRIDVLARVNGASILSPCRFDENVFSSCASEQF